MKKTLLFLAITILTVIGASARDRYSRDASTLPKAAQTTIANNCKAKVSVIKVDKDFGRVNDYEVILTDGTEIDFDRNGNWKDMEVGAGKSVPEGFIPTAISNYVNKNNKGVRIVGIEKKRSGYEVQLSNGLDLRFDKKGNFVRFD